MRSLPGMTILSPSDAVSTSEFVHALHQQPGPKYIRIEKGKLGQIYAEGHDFSAGFEMLIEGADLVIISTGVMVHRALEVAEELSHHGLDCGVMDLYRLKPADPEALLEPLSTVGRLVTLEEHSVIGGIGSMVAEILADSGRQVPLKRLALPDRFAYKYGSREWLHTQDGLDSDSVVKKILGWIGGRELSS